MLRPAVLLCVLSAWWTSSASATVFAQDDFEQADTTCWTNSQCAGYEVHGAGITSMAVGQVSHSGDRALKLTFTANEQEGGARKRLDPKEHLFTRYYDYYVPGFDFACGMKVHRLTSQIGEYADFDIIAYNTGTPTSGDHDYCGVNPMGGQHVAYNGGPDDWGALYTSTRFEEGRWYCVEHEVLLNHPGTSDGEVRFWVDGQLAGEKTGLNVRDTLSSGITVVLFGGWYSNGCGGENPCINPAVTSERYIDDVAIADERIGCLSDMSDPGDANGSGSANGGCGYGGEPAPVPVLVLLAAVAWTYHRQNRLSPPRS